MNILKHCDEPLVQVTMAMVLWVSDAEVDSDATRTDEAPRIYNCL